MTNQSNLTEQQVAAAIRAGLREGRLPVNLSPAEAQMRAATYRGNLAHYRQHVQTSLDAGDYLQMAEKSWGAYAQTIKAISADHLLRIRHHGSVVGVADGLAMLVNASDAVAGHTLSTGLAFARSLHQHWYENDLSDAMVIANSDDVMAAIDLMQALFAPDPSSP